MHMENQQMEFQKQKWVSVSLVWKCRKEHDSCSVQTTDSFNGLAHTQSPRLSLDRNAVNPHLKHLANPTC